MTDELLRRMKRQNTEWFDAEPYEDWWQYQRDFAQAIDVIETTRAELAASKERERETLAVLQTAHESEAALVAKVSARDAALREALALMRGEPDMSLPGSDHWLWAKKVRELIGEGEPT